MSGSYKQVDLPNLEKLGVKVFTSERLEPGEISFRSMGRLEIWLRGLAGSGWTGEHPTGYRWAQRLCDLLERKVWAQQPRAARFGDATAAAIGEQELEQR